MGTRNFSRCRIIVCRVATIYQCGNIQKITHMSYSGKFVVQPYFFDCQFSILSDMVCIEVSKQGIINSTVIFQRQ